MEKINRLDETVDLAFTFNYFGLSIRPGQFRNEITQLLNNVGELQPKNLMEIGTAKGGTLFLFCQTSDPMAQVISVDLPGGKFGGGYSNAKRKFYKSLAKPNQQIILIRKNAHESSTLNEVKIVLAGKALDFLFIDGDHTYEGVKKDFEMYSPLVRKGGAIAFHDIAKHPSTSQCEVNRFWNEIKNSHKFREFVNDWNQGIYGIGLIYV
jgi:predicted O-methyltransferase YrrM